METAGQESAPAGATDDAAALGAEPAFETARKKLADIFKGEGRPLDILEVRSRHFATEVRMNYNDDFLDVLKPFVGGEKVLDIFAGSQKTREFYEQEGLPVSVTSVDVTPGRADLAIDVAEIAKHIKPERQFAFVFSFGGHPGFTDYEAIRDLLKDDGCLVTGASEEMFSAHELPALTIGEARGQGPYEDELREILKRFHPVATVRVRGIRGWYGPTIADKDNPEGAQDKVYVLWRKRKVDAGGAE